MTVTLNLGHADDAHTRKSLHQLSLAVAKSKRVVVVTGAGISCSCGIPDFRSTDGLYNLVKSQYPNTLVKGRDLFDSSLFRDQTSTAIFYTFIANLKSAIDNTDPGPTHQFIKTLDAKGKLLRSYTQNIDGLEERVGLVGTSSEHARTKSSGTSKSKPKLKLGDVKNVLLHGDIHRVRCTLCSFSAACEPSHLDAFKSGIPPDCPECWQRSSDRVARSQRSVSVGTLRPAIVLYDEPHPMGDEIGAIESRDLSKKPDLLIIMGTSLKVHGLKKLVKDFATAVHNSAPSQPSSSSSLPTLATSKPKSSASNFLRKVIFVNKTPPSSEWNGIIDYHVQGTTDDWTDKVVGDWKKTRPQDWEIQQTLLFDGVVLPHRQGAGMQVIKDLSTGKGGVKGTKGFQKASKPRADDGDDGENVDPQLSQETLVDADNLPSPRKLAKSNSLFKTSSYPARPPQPKPKPSKANAKGKSKAIPPSRPVPLSPSKRANRASSSCTPSSGDVTEVEDNDEEMGSPRKKQKWTRQAAREDDGLGDVSMRSDRVLPPSAAADEDEVEVQRGLLDFSLSQKGSTTMTTARRGRSTKISTRQPSRSGTGTAVF